MKAHIHSGFINGPVSKSTSTFSRCSRLSQENRQLLNGIHAIRRISTGNRTHVRLSASNQRTPQENLDCTSGRVVEQKEISIVLKSRRRAVLLAPLLALTARALLPKVANADEKSAATEVKTLTTPPVLKSEEQSKKEVEDVILSRIYDATAIGEPVATGKDKSKIWEKMMNARIVYLGEAEQVPTKEDKELELEIVKNLRRRCGESERSLSLALEAFSSDLQQQLDQYMDKRIDGEALKSYASHWPPERWQEYEPLLSYCRDNGVRLVACGIPQKILRSVQAEGIRGLSKADRKTYAPPAGSGFISGFSSLARRLPADVNSLNPSVSFGPSSYLSAQARVVEDYAMSQTILQNVLEGGASGILVVVTGATHVTYGPRGTGVPARISKKMQKKNQVVVLLNPERQLIRREGEVPVADFLWYSAARPCNRNCFDRAEIARVMNAAGRKRDALPQDIQKGLDLGLVSPEVLQNFFDLEKYPLLSELSHRFQGFRERLLADPKFLHRLAIEEAISMTTTLLAQYERRKEIFFDELDYVITDTLRGTVVDFFTVWLPAPTLSFLSYVDDIDMSDSDSLNSLRGLLGSIPDNAFQKSFAGKDWSFSHRIASVLFGGVKLASVGFVSSLGAVAASNSLYAIRRFLSPGVLTNQHNKRSPILKTAAVYALFLGTSANLRYQIIAGVVEHRVAEALSSQTLLVNMLSFVVRTINSYWGTQQWVDLARFTGFQSRKDKSVFNQMSDSLDQAATTCNKTEDVVDEVKNQCGDNTSSSSH